MDRVWWDRWSPLSGVVFVVLLIVGFIVVGDFPALADPAEEFAAFYADDRGRILAGAIIWAFALVFFAWFAAALAGRVRDHGERRLSAAALVGGAAFAGMSLVAVGMLIGLAHTGAGEVEPDVVKAVSSTGSGVDIVSVLPFAVLVLAFGIAATRTELVASWFGYASIAAAVVIALGGTTWANDGFWSPYGGWGWITFIALIAWVLVASALLVARPAAPEAQTRAAPPPP